MSARVSNEEFRTDNLDVSLKMEFGTFEVIHKWTLLSECNEFVGARRSKHTAIAYKDAIYVFGGDNGKSMLNDLIRYDIQESSWTKAGCMGSPPAPRYHHSAVVHRHSMFIFGGYTGDILANSNLTNKNDLFEYKFTSATWFQWKFIGPEPVPRSAHGAAVYDDKLWIFAGYDGNARLNDMWTCNLVGEIHTWEKIEQKGTCPPTCCNFPICVARGKMFVFSGQSGAKITNALFQFDFETHTWSRVCTEHLLRCAGPAPARRYGHVMAAHQSQLYVFGGAADNTLPADLHCYDLDTQMWSVVQPSHDSQVPTGRLFHAGAISDNSLFIFGGTVDNNVRSGELFRFQLSSYPRCTLHEDFGRILKSQQFCDITLLVGPDQTPVLAHQAIMASRSHYLKTKIKEARIERDRLERERQRRESCEFAEFRKPLEVTIKIPEAHPEAFKMVLNYIYTDRIDPTEKDEDPASSGTVLLVMEVLRLTLRLNIPRLRGLCTRFLRATLCSSNVLPALHKAHHANLTCIKEYCLRYIVKDYNFTPIVMSEEFEQIEQHLMVEIIRRRQQPHTRLAVSACDSEDERISGTTLEQDMATLINSDSSLSDVVLQVGNTCRRAHRSVLAARASYFEAMFRSFSPKNNRVELSDMIPSDEAFDSLLRYIYYGDTKMPTEDALYLFQAPIYYGFTNNRLQVFCKHNLQSNVCQDNVLAILQAADRLGAADIKDYALRMIVHHFTQVAKQDAVKNLSQPLLLDIIWALAEETSNLPQLTDTIMPTSASNDTLSEDIEQKHRGATKS